ncbi:MAG: hypothetical protein K1X82_13645 [Bacteroidia bacterium]|nr:hypothetical protein [Bacteroidia bacterium]
MKRLSILLAIITLAVIVEGCGSGYHPGATGYHYSHKRRPVKKLYSSKRHLFEYTGNRKSPFW